MIEINLIPDVKQELIKAQRVRSTVITISILIGLISIGVVAALAMSVLAVQALSGIADGNIKTDSSKLLNVSDLNKTVTLQNQLTKISALNSNKKIDSRIFGMLTAVIPPSPNDVQISTLTIDSTTNTITIDGQASNSYAAVEVFKKTIEGATVKYTDSDSKARTVALATDISTSNTSYGEDSSGNKVLRFTISFTYASEFFDPSSKNVSVVITTNGDATDSYLGVPKSVFADRATDLKGGQ